MSISAEAPLPETTAEGAASPPPAAADGGIAPPGGAPALPRPHRMHSAAVTTGCLLLLAVAWALVELWGLGAVPFHTKGEPREALVVWEMTHNGGWILPQRNGEELPSKPPLFHWLAALTSIVHGATDEWSIRFPSAALSLLSLLCVFATGAALWNARAGVFAALVLMTTFEWARAATSARVDMTLTFGLEIAFLSLLFFLRSFEARWLAPLYLGISLAVLGKGPVGAVLPGLVALVMLLAMRNVRRVGELRLGYGTIVVSVLAGSWYVLALALGGLAFFRKQVLAENVFTFLNNADYNAGHRHAVAYLIGVLLLGVLPWTVALPGVAARLWRDRRALSASDVRVFLLAWVGIVFAFYAVAASKRGVYLLSLYPALALLVGWWWDELAAGAAAPRWWRAGLLPLAGVVLALLGMVTVLAALQAVGVPVAAALGRWRSAAPYAQPIAEIIHDGRWSLLPLLALGTAAAAVSLRAVRRERWTAAFAGLSGTVAAVIVAINLIVLPGIARIESYRDFIANVRRAIGSDVSLSFYDAFDYGAVFYWHGHIPQYTGAWPDGAPAYVLVNSDRWPQLQYAAAGAYERVAVPDTAPAGVQRLILLRRVAR